MDDETVDVTDAVEATEPLRSVRALVFIRDGAKGEGEEYEAGESFEAEAPWAKELVESGQAVYEDEPEEIVVATKETEA